MLNRSSQHCHPSIQECCHWCLLLKIRRLSIPIQRLHPHILGLMYKYIWHVWSNFLTTECNTKFSALCYTLCITQSFVSQLSFPITYLSMYTLGTREHWCQDCCSGVQLEVYGLWVCLQVTFQGNKDRLAIDFFPLPLFLLEVASVLDCSKRKQKS